MSQQPMFTIATLGFDERERVMLRDAFRVSEHLTPIFRTLVKDARALPHIVIVNADHADAVARWESFRRANERKGKLSTLMWSAKPRSDSSQYALGRPATLTQFFAVLERIVTEEHGYVKPSADSGTPSLLALSSPTPVAPTSAVTPVTAAAVPSSGDLAHAATVIIPKVSAATTPPPTGGEEIAVIMEPPARESAAGVAAASAAAVASAEASAPRAAFATRAATPQSRFLVVDDSLPVRIQMKEALKSYAKTIDFAHSGEEAMFLIDNCKYDVIFLDVILPGKDGYEVCRYIRSHTLQRQTPVIMLTGNSSPADRVKGKLAGCDTYLIKPVRASVLSEIIGEFTKSSAVA